MEKLLLLSVLIGMIAIPLRAASSRHPANGLKTALVQVLGFNTLYWVAVLVLYFTLWLGRSPAQLLSSSVGS